MKTLLLDPRIFNYVIMGLYALNVIRWGIARSWVDAIYWGSALSLTMCITFGYKR